jgi:hypothetical protein
MMNMWQQRSDAQNVARHMYLSCAPSTIAIVNIDVLFQVLHIAPSVETPSAQNVVPTMFIRYLVSLGICKTCLAGTPVNSKNLKTGIE